MPSLPSTTVITGACAFHELTQQDSPWLEAESEILAGYILDVEEVNLPMIRIRLQAVRSVREAATIGRRSRWMTSEPQKTTQQKREEDICCGYRHDIRNCGSEVVGQYRFE